MNTLAKSLDGIDAQVPAMRESLVRLARQNSGSFNVDGVNAVGRDMAALFAPADRLAEFFGLWTVAVRLSAIVGPITYGLVTVATGGNHRIAILSTGVFFVIGLWVLRRVDMQRGMAAASASV